MITDKIDLLNQYVLILTQLEERTNKLEEEVYTAMAEFKPDKRHSELVNYLIEFVELSKGNVKELVSIAKVLVKHSTDGLTRDIDFYLLLERESMYEKASEIFLQKWSDRLEDLKNILQ
jgi:hypothetical protein